MFSQDVKTKAMLACGRRCCLCHKFAGVGMECHHIVPQAKDGDDSFENCIPLCFDCHAEVGHYSDDHPKGTKFSSAELRGHRDYWYAAHASGRGPTAPADYLELDRKLYQKLSVILGGSDGMLHFRDHDYGNSYSQKYENRLYEFIYAADLPETEFFDAQMESAFSDLHAAVGAYKKAAADRVWFEANDEAGIPRDWIHGDNPQEKRFWEAVEVMNKAATAIWDAFCQFVKTARSSLKVEQ